MFEMIPIIYHNPECGTSRNVLAVLKDAGYEPHIIEYTKVGFARDELISLLSQAGLTARQALRETKSPAKDLGLLDEAIPDSDILEAMLIHPFWSIVLLWSLQWAFDCAVHRKLS